MKRFFAAVIASLIGLAGCSEGLPPSGTPHVEDAGNDKQKVVYHIDNDDPKQQKSVLRNIQNHINAVGRENLDLRVIMHGNGVSMVLLPEALDNVTGFKAANANTEQQATIDNLKAQGVTLKVCAITLKRHKVNRERDLYRVDEADIVPSGIAELAVLQTQGFSYIKP